MRNAIWIILATAAATWTGAATAQTVMPSTDPWRAIRPPAVRPPPRADDHDGRRRFRPPEFFDPARTGPRGGIVVIQPGYAWSGDVVLRPLDVGLPLPAQGLLWRRIGADAVLYDARSGSIIEVRSRWFG